MRNQLPCLEDTETTIVSRKYIYFPKESHFNIRKISEGEYAIRASSNGHRCCEFNAQEGEVMTITESYKGRSVRVHTNIMVNPYDAERINTP